MVHLRRVHRGCPPETGGVLGGRPTRTAAEHQQIAERIAAEPV